MYFAADSDIALWNSGLDAEGCFKDQSQARGPSAPQFWLLHFAYTVFDVERPNLAWLHIWGRVVFKGSATPHPITGGGRSAP